MQVKIKTAVLQDMMNKAVKGAGNDKAMPITQLMGVEVDEGYLCLTTTDGENFLTVFDKPEEVTDPAAFCVSAEMFSKLVLKTTSEFITLTLDKNVLKVKGNGTYTFPLSSDEEGDLVSIPHVSLKGLEGVEILGEVDAKEFKELYSIGKTALATNNAERVFTGFYLDKNGVVTSNGAKATLTRKVITQTPLLLSNALMALATLINAEKVKFHLYEGKVFATGKGIAICGVCMPELGEYPIESISEFVATEFQNNVKLNKAALTNILDRVGLFIGAYDKNGVSFNFGENGVIVADLHGAASELLKAEGKVESFTAVLDIQSLRDMLSVNPDEAISLDYGKKEAIRVSFGDTVQVLSTQLDENEVPAEAK